MRNFIAVLFLSFFIQSFLSAQNQGTFLNQDSFFRNSAVKKMQLISDSLHAQYNSVPHHQSYWSLPQARGNWIFMDSLAHEGQAFLKTNPTFEAFLKRFPFVKTEKNVLILREKEDYYSNEKTLKFHPIPEQYPYELTMVFNPVLYTSSLEKQWIDTILKAHEYRPHDELVACFFEKGFKSQLLPDKYAQYIQYVDFIADTNTVVFPNKGKQIKNLSNDIFPVRTAFYKLFSAQDDDNWMGRLNYYENYNKFWQIDSVTEQKLIQNTQLRKLLIAASDEVLIKQSSTAQLENLVLRYISPIKALQMKRLRYVWSGCGNDNAPRFHLYNIAQLAAQTGKWDIFISSYLSLFRYPFDGQHSQKELKFYTQILESIHVKVTDLYLGAFLHINNPAKNHFEMPYSLYYGKADIILEYSQFKVLKEQLLKAIGDTQLDDYNRYQFWEKYSEIVAAKIYNEKDKILQKELEKELNIEKEKSKATLPFYISSRIKEKE